MEHTSWVAKEGPHTDSPSDWFVVSEDGVTIALMVGAPHTKWKEHARLISAAPDLLEACKAARTRLVVIRQNDALKPNVGTSDPWIAILEDAIAKATHE